MTVEVRRSSSPGETERIAEALGRRLSPGTVIALEGDLGAGKTCFVRGLARGLGGDPSAVSSPTFVIEHRHRCEGMILAHVDAYRVRTAEDLASIGWDELVGSGDAVVAVEWPSRIAAALPAARIEVRIRDLGDGVREIEIERIRPGERSAACRACGAALHAAGDGRFCSERCRLADLGRWFRGDYAIGRPIEDDDLADGDAGTGGRR